MMLPRIALPLGDPAGIGAEVALKALADAQMLQDCTVTLIGSGDRLQRTHRDLTALTQEPLADPAGFDLVDLVLDGETEARIVPGEGNAASGAASFAYLKEAIARTLAGEFDAIVTAPIAKACWQAAGHDYPGQTEVLAEAAEVERFGMLFVARSPHTGWTLRTLLATTHIPLRQVPDALTPTLMAMKLDLLEACLRQEFHLAHPTIAIAGLNPHSGEQGQLGKEEQEWLADWIEKTAGERSHLHLQGPVPPDTLWVKPGQAWFGNPGGAVSPAKRASLGETLHPLPPTPSPLLIDAADAYLALYHDQGLIPVKLMAFDRAVNTTIGLPFVRTSPDHGTAFDIAGKGIASATSMVAALKFAVELVRNRQSQALARETT